MSDAALGYIALRGRVAAGEPAGVARPDRRRALQPGLAARWLLDGVPQFQPSMYWPDGAGRMEPAR